MKLAITTWNNRIAPVFDSASNCILFEATGDVITQKEVIIMTNDSFFKKIGLLDTKGVNALICGAISRECEEALIQNGVKVYSFVAGEVSDVLNGFKDKSLFSKRFSMPGCGCPRRRCGRQNRFGWKGRR